jgi:hypothetical protein
MECGRKSTLILALSHVADFRPHSNRSFLHILFLPIFVKFPMETFIAVIVVAWSFFALCMASVLAQRQEQQQSISPEFLRQELSVNFFRNPSIGLEWRYSQVSIHAGYYLTNFEPNVTTEFIRSGVTFWFLPFATNGDVPSSFYSSVSYLYGLTREWTGSTGMMLEAGFRWMPWRGLNVRLGVDVLLSPNQAIKVNPNPGVSWSFVL